MTAPRSPIDSSIDLIVTDLDGTLWDHNTDVHPQNRAALDTVVAAGIPVVAATGRRKVSALRGFAHADLDLPAIVINGAYGFVPGPTAAHETEFHRHPFEVELALVVLEIYADHGHVPLAHNIDGSTHVSERATTGPRHRSTFSAADAVRAEPHDAARDGTVLGFSVIGVAESEGLPELGAALLDAGVNVDRYRDPLYGGWSVMVQAPGVSKWLGVQRYCEFVGLVEPTVLAIGDGGNDVELLEGADVSLGIEGGDDQALEVADHVIPPPTQGGWAAVLDYL
ncbi:MAG: HAD family phosphatase [Acidimicrobiales bacterium]|nr:HAD family phosphatase [Acidimicrobiales bacterium]